MNNHLSLISLALLSVSLLPAKNFTTELNSIRNAVPSEVNGEPALFLSELAGGVACYTLDGTELWKQPTKTPAVLFEIVADDIDRDGEDELLAASGDGNIYCWDNNGRPLWTFSPDHKVRFSEVAVVQNGDQTQIFVGGNDYQLYELNAQGTLVSQTKIEGVVRKIESGDFLKDGQESLFLMTYVHDKFRWQFMGILDPNTKKKLSSLDYRKKGRDLSNLMITDIRVSDIDQDQRDDLLFFGDNSLQAAFFGLNGQFDTIARNDGSRKHKQRYAHNKGLSLLPAKEAIVMQHGATWYLMDLQGQLLEMGKDKYKGLILNDLVLDSKNGKVFGIGQVGGGNTIYPYDLNKRNWIQTEHTVKGRIAEVEANLETLYQQALKFELPDYQKPASKQWVMISSNSLTKEFDALKAAEVVFPHQVAMQENFDRSQLVEAIGEIANKRDKRKRYNMSQAEIVALARKLEKEGTPFTAWTGHGNDPFITSLDTMIKVLEAAPTTCYGFIYAEMHNIEDPRVHHFIEEYVPKLAKAMRKQGRAKLYFRYKNMFWAASSHQQPWKEMFFGGKYKDILVPCAEDTSSRTQDLNFTGRVGMFAGGYVDDYGMRLVDDNPTSWRPLTPGGQRSVSPYLRNGALMAAYGARYGLIIGNNYLDEPKWNILYALMKSGALPIVEKEDILSIGSWHLIHEVDHDLVHSVDNHHKMTQYSPDDVNAVISVAQMHWAGTSLPEHDYSKVALGLDYRWLNYLPPLPYGMIPVAPVESAKALQASGVPYSISNTKVGYINGQPAPATRFGKTMQAVAKLGASKLPILVEGAAWSVIRIDDTHVRLLLVDPGYIDPQEREATITFQTAKPSSAVDILSKETINLNSKQLKLTVPAGSMRFIDLSYQTKI